MNTFSSYYFNTHTYLTRLKNSYSPVIYVLQEGDGRFSSAGFFLESSVSDHFNKTKNKKSKSGVTGDNLFQSCEAVQEIFLFDSKFSVLVNVGSVC